jgi:hypothetical protein
MPEILNSWTNQGGANGKTMLRPLGLGEPTWRFSCETAQALRCFDSQPLIVEEFI